MSWVSIGWRDISASLYSMLSFAVPLLINFIEGVSVEKKNPGFICRIWVDVAFVSSSVIVSFVMLNCFVIVVDCNAPASLYRISDISIEKFPSLVVYA